MELAQRRQPVSLNSAAAADAEKEREKVFRISTHPSLSTQQLVTTRPPGRIQSTTSPSGAGDGSDRPPSGSDSEMLQQPPTWSRATENTICHSATSCTHCGACQRPLVLLASLDCAPLLLHHSLASSSARSAAASPRRSCRARRGSCCAIAQHWAAL